MRIIRCEVDHKDSPMGFAMECPVFSYITEGAKGKRQTEARIAVSTDAEGKLIAADTGFTEINSLGHRVDMTLSPYTKYYWTVTVRTDAGEEAVSAVNWFETGKRGEAWEGQWITCGTQEKRHPVFHKAFHTEPDKCVESARLYISGLGMYEAEINGRAVTKERFTPYCNDYTAWVQYQTYDVTELLGQDNEISVLMGNGWYKGRFGFQSKPGDEGFYGNQYQLIAELRIRYTDGTEQIEATDESWTVTRSKITFSSIYDGEQQDDTLEALPEERAVYSHPGLCLQERRSLPVLIQEERKPAALLDTPAGEKVFDLGQNITGIFRLRVREPKGTRIRVQMGEVLQQGNFYRDNLRSALAEYVYICDGTEHVIEPHFTFYGYRYAKVEGVSHLNVDDFIGLVCYSDIKTVSAFTTGDAKLNQLLSNIRWGQKGNFLDVPTDCPQRDERMGWTADTQVFVPTACFMTDAYAFYDKFLYDLRQEQSHRDGLVPDVVPAFQLKGCSSVWGDAAAIIPWFLYVFYGDVQILKDSFQSIKDWIDFIAGTDGENHHWREVFHYGDWLALDHPSGKVDEVKGGTEDGFIADAYYLNSVRIFIKAAKLLGETALAQEYQKKADHILQEIRNEYYSPNGRCVIPTQTAQILSVFYDLTVNPERAHQALMKLLRDHGNKLQTGFVGTPLLNRVLSGFGEDKMAYEILHNEEYPGWLYEVNLGATTVWERWNSMNPDGSVSSTGMNSFNHYAYGAIGEWMFRTMAGINPTENAPGFRHALLRPVVDLQTGFVKAEYASPAGTYRIEWSVTDKGCVHLKAEVPFDCTAELILPYCKETKPILLEPGVYEYTYETEGFLN